MQRFLGLSAVVLIVLLGACQQANLTTTSNATVNSTQSPPDSVPTVQATTPDSIAPSASTLPPVTSNSGCVTAPGALQAMIDSVPDGKAVSDMKGKLINAPELGFSVLDLSSDCFDNQGKITITGRYGLWIVRPTTYGSDWYISDSSDMVLSGLDLNGGTLSITGGSHRVEAGEVHDLNVSDARDFMMGKMVVTGHSHFHSMWRSDSDKSFVRNSEFNTIEISGDIDGFKFESSTAASIENNTETESNLNLRGVSTRFDG